jgi:AraC-like DNA-binding protein
MDTDVMVTLSALVAGIAVAGLIAARHGAGNQRARYYLMATFTVFLLIASIPNVVVYARPLYVFYLPLILPALFILPVSIHNYARARASPDDPPLAKWRDGGLPVVGLVVALGYWSLPSETKALLLIRGELPQALFPTVLVLVTFGLILLWSLVSLGYVIATVRALWVHRQRLKALYSNTDQYELRWIDGFLVLLVALWAAAALSLTSDNLGSGLLLPSQIVFLLAAITLLFLLVFSLAPEPVAETESVVEDHPDALSKDKYARSALTSEHAAQIAERIEAAMRRDKVYLDANLSLQKLSRHVRAPQNLVSQTLNHALDASFFDYVARWRVEAAKPMIESGQLSVLAIALEVGFNSRSTFYKAFKRETGLTPKAFRARQ